MEEGNSDWCQQVGTQIISSLRSSHCLSPSPLFLLCPELELEPDTEDKVVSVVIVLWPLLVDLKLRPDLPLWKDLVLPLRNKLLVPLRVLLSLFQIDINSQCPLRPSLTWHSCGRRCGCCSRWGWGCLRCWRPCVRRRRLTSSRSSASASWGSRRASGWRWAASRPGSGASWAGRHWTCCIFFCVFTQITLTHNGYLQ